MRPPRPLSHHRPACAPAHIATAHGTAGRGCHGRTCRPPYDRRVTERRNPDRGSFPGGIAATRRSVRALGGLTGVAVSLSIAVAGWLAKVAVGGAVGGAVSFTALVAAFPLMPIAGIPAASGTLRIAGAVIASLAVWWVLGQMVAGRVTRRAVAGWQEWTREFLVLGSGLWLGAVGAVLLAALALGAL